VAAGSKSTEAYTKGDGTAGDRAAERSGSAVSGAPQSRERQEEGEAESSIEESLDQVTPPSHKVGQPFQPIVSQPANTNAGSDTVITFTQPVKAVMLQNLTAVAVNFNFDAPAGAGTFQLAANGQAQAFYVPCQTVHLQTAAAQPINAAAGIIVKGW
jgi:hypothetical protein